MQASETAMAAIMGESGANTHPVGPAASDAAPAT